MKRKLQVFVSSTYLDLQNERQAAVQAIIDAGHIPAGMELFRAGNESQLTTIKKWIDASDAYMLIMGGRFGSVDEVTGKSYTQIEYEYALEIGIPVFAVVLTESYIFTNASKLGREKTIETANIEKLDNFRKLVLTKIVKYVEDEKDIKLAVHATLADFNAEYNLIGWIRGDVALKNESLLEENKSLLTSTLEQQKQISKLEEKVKALTQKIESKNLFGECTYDELKLLLLRKSFILEKDISSSKKDETINGLDLYLSLFNSFTTGITNRNGASKLHSKAFFDFCPFYASFGLLEKVKVAGVTWQRFQTTKDGLRFFSKLAQEYGLET